VKAQPIVEIREWLPGGRRGRVLVCERPVSGFILNMSRPTIEVPLDPRDKGYGNPFVDPLRLYGTPDMTLRFNMKLAPETMPPDGIVRVEAFVRQKRKYMRIVLRRCSVHSLPTAWPNVRDPKPKIVFTVVAHALMDSTVKGNRRHGTIGWIEDTRR
jgi:hypothetical protein